MASHHVVLSLRLDGGDDDLKFQMSDAVPTFKRFTDLAIMCARKPSVPAASYRWFYVDDEGDSVTIKNDDDVVELIAVAKALGDRSLAVIALTDPELPAPGHIRSTRRGATPAVTRTTPAVAATPPPVPSSPYRRAVRSPAEWSSTLTFYLNSVPITITNPDPRMLLVDYIRDVAFLKGTKIGCGEGGCGACTVVLSWEDPTTKETKYEPVNSCLRPLCSMDGYHVITTEGLGSKMKDYHPIQTAIAENNGSQCGFCSPGWATRAYALLQSDPKPDAALVDNSFDGNLCRCTGYFPILNGIKTFSPDGHVVPPGQGSSSSGTTSSEAKSGGCCGSCKGCSKKGTEETAHHHSAAGAAAGAGGSAPDMEDLVTRSSAAGGGCCGSKSSSCAPRELPPAIPLPDALKGYTPAPRHYSRTLGGSSVEWYAPTTLADLTALQKQFLSSPAGTVKFVCGNTAYGVEKYYTGNLAPVPYSVFIDVTNVPEMTNSTQSSSALVVGAAVSLNELIALCNKMDPAAPTRTNDAKAEIAGTATSSFAALARHLLIVANQQVRSVGSWAGNLMLATHHHDFPSDVALVLMSLGCTLTVIQVGETRTGVPVDQLYALSQTNNASTIVVSMTIPNLIGLTASTPGSYAIDSYKAMDRHQNSHALSNAAFTVEITKAFGGLVASNARLFFGGVGTELFRARGTEAALNSKPISQGTLQACLAALNKDIDTVGPATYFGTTDAYRRQLVAAMLYKFFMRILPSSSIIPTMASAALRYVRPVSSESSVFASDPSEKPVSSPVIKLGALQQLAGEAAYSFDEKATRDGLQGSLAVTTVAYGVITAIDTSAAATMPGVVRVLTVADIPSTGKNDIGAMPGQEKLFLGVGDSIGCVGQSVALVLADTFEHALAASRAVTVATSAPTTDPIFTIEDAIAKKAFYPNTPAGRLVPPTGIKKGDVDTALKSSAHVASGTVSFGFQKHFYMEVQNASAQMMDDEYIMLQASTQSPAIIQSSAMRIVGLPANKVKVSSRRSGGGYGGKATRCLPVTAAATLAAYVTGRQCHVKLERVQDLEMTGGREQMMVEYEIGVDSDNHITGCKFTVYTNGGAFMDGAYGDIDMAQMWADNTYFFPTYFGIGYVCKTNLPATTSMRAPGLTQSIVAMETVLERIAIEVGVDPMAFRVSNFLRLGETTPYGQAIKYFSLPTVWSQLMDQCNYTSAKAAVDAFNKANRWRKRGIHISPLKYGITMATYNASTVIRIYPEDGTVEVSTSGCEIGQGLYTKVAQVAAFELGVPLSMIRVVPTTSNQTPALAVTGGSATSETSAQATINACTTINNRLAAIKKANPDYSWLEIIEAATAASISLTAEGFFSPEPAPGTVFNYYVYAANFSTVEIDVLTGEVQLLDMNMVYDCGESLSPDIDVGQVEGAMVMGLGEYFSEQAIYDTKTGKFLNQGTWEYKPPFSLDVPQVMKLTLLKDCPNPAGILRSKATGEPAFVLGSSAFFAAKYAIASAREDAGTTGFFDLPVPATPCAIATACLTTTDMFEL